MKSLQLESLVRAKLDPRADLYIEYRPLGSPAGCTVGETLIDAQILDTKEWSAHYCFNEETKTAEVDYYPPEDGLPNFFEVTIDTDYLNERKGSRCTTTEIEKAARFIAEWFNESYLEDEDEVEA